MTLRAEWHLPRSVGREGYVQGVAFSGMGMIKSLPCEVELPVAHRETIRAGIVVCSILVIS